MAGRLCSRAIINATAAVMVSLLPLFFVERTMLWLSRTDTVYMRPHIDGGRNFAKRVHRRPVRREGLPFRRGRNRDKCAARIRKARKNMELLGLCDFLLCTGLFAKTVGPPVWQNIRRRLATAGGRGKTGSFCGKCATRRAIDGHAVLFC